MSDARLFEAVLARLYTDAVERARFCADPLAYALAAGLDPDQAADIAAIDRSGLALTAQSFARKRPAAHGGGARWMLRRWLARFGVAG